MTGNQARLGLGPDGEREQEFDNNGWAHIHHAAYNGYQKSVQRFVKTKPERLEILTQDDQQLTPFLAACKSGKLETIEVLIDLGANVAATDRKMLGAVELASLGGNYHVLEHLLHLDVEINVYERLYNCLTGNNNDAELEMAVCHSLNVLCKDPNCCEEIVESKGIKTMMKLLGSSFSNDPSKDCVLETLLKVIQFVPAHAEVLESNGLETIVTLLKSSTLSIINKVIKLIEELALHSGNNSGLKHQFESLYGLSFIVKILKNNKDDLDLVINCLDTLTVLVAKDGMMQNSFDSQANGIDILIDVVNSIKDSSVLCSAVKTITAVIEENKAMQTVFVELNGIPSLLNLLKSKSAECVMNTVTAIKKLAEENEHSQEMLLKHGTVNLLIRILKRSRETELKAVTAGALWAIAGQKFHQRRAIATCIGVNTCVEFLASSACSQLHFCSSEALGTLTKGVGTEIDDIASSGGLQRLLHIIANTATSSFVALSMLQTFRNLCIAPGYFPHTVNQKIAASEGAIRILVNFANIAKTSLQQAEAYYTLASVVFGNKENLSLLFSSTDFTYIDILELLYSNDDYIRQISGSALALCAFNNRKQLQLIAYAGGIPYQHFVPFFSSDDKARVAHTAFQIVVLSKIIPDETPALSSAAGIKIIVDLLQHDNEEIKVLSSNLLCGLANLKSGIPDAIISIGTIHVLCKLLNSQFDIVRASAAVTLSILSYQPKGQRQLINECRLDPYLFKVLQEYPKRVKLPEDLLKRWKHHKNVGLPPIRHTNPPLSSTNYLMIKDQTNLSLSPSVMMDDEADDVPDSNLPPNGSLSNFKLPIVRLLSAIFWHDSASLTYESKNHARKYLAWRDIRTTHKPGRVDLHEQTIMNFYENLDSKLADKQICEFPYSGV
eukprot:gene19265-21194_t